MPHPKFCNMLHADRATLLWQIRLSVCLSVRLSVRLYTVQIGENAGDMAKNSVHGRFQGLH